MKIAIGTTNKGKIAALKNALSQYPQYADSEIISVSVISGVADQPVGLEATINGAKNRARAAFEATNAALAVGLESGIFSVPHTKSEYMDTTACAIYDGQTYHLGLSSCFEYPKAMIEKVIAEGKAIGPIALEMGFADDPKFAEEQGMIGILTKGIVSRTAYSEQAVHMALIHLLNDGHY